MAEIKDNRIIAESIHEARQIRLWCPNCPAFASDACDGMSLVKQEAILNMQNMSLENIAEKANCHPDSQGT